MKQSSCTEILEGMLALLQAGWCQGNYYERQEDESDSFCLKGSWHKATGNAFYRPHEVNKALLKAIYTVFPDWKCTMHSPIGSDSCLCEGAPRWHRIVHFNDDPHRSREDVILVVKQAIADSREKEEVHGEVHMRQERAGAGSR